jgi:hypothetical protein
LESLGSEFVEKHQMFSKQVESKGFWRWYMTLKITGFLDFVHHPEF